ncbi:MAG: helix-turn-helix domain-containing protein [Dehalococcoidia bacterium]
MKDIKAILKERYGRGGRDIVLDGADVINQKGYTVIPNYILNHEKLSPYAKLVYTMILSYAWGDKNAAFPGQERLASDCGISLRTVVRSIQELQEGKFLSVLRRGRGLTNLYVLHFKRR